MAKIQLIVLTGILVTMPVVGDAQQSPKWSQALTLYVECLQDLGLRGNYTWTDGGSSAMRLGDACSILRKPVIEECMAGFFNVDLDEKTCKLISLGTAQTVLRALHK